VRTIAVLGMIAINSHNLINREQFNIPRNIASRFLRSLKFYFYHMILTQIHHVQAISKETFHVKSDTIFDSYKIMHQAFSLV